ncbi:hypothetical protein AAMO2058_000978900 [Amorphochlora amoebiformis]
MSQPSDSKVTETNGYSKQPYDLVYLKSSPLLVKNLNQVFNVPPLDVKSEEKAFDETMRESGMQLRFKKDFATVNRLCTNVILGCKVLHYTGHGLENGLAFEDEFGFMHIVSPEHLRELISAGRKEASVKLVFVAACHSEPAGRAFIEAGVKHVIAAKIKEKIADKGARQFMRYFYLSLLTGRTVREAYDAAIVNLRAAACLPSARDEAKKYLLLPTEGNHDVRIFPSLKEGKAGDCTRTLALNNLPAPADHFLGRSFDVQRIVETFLRAKKRLVTLTGPKGVGKTEVARGAATYMHQRGAFKDGIFHLRLGDFSDAEDMKKEDIAMAIVDSIDAIPEVDTSHKVKPVLKRWLRRKEVLLVMDGLDSLLKSKVKGPPIRSLIQELLEDCPPLKILATSCERIGITRGVEEVELNVGPIRVGEICLLFSKLAGETLTNEQVGLKGESGMYLKHEILEAMEKHRLFKDIIKGHPGLCWEAVQIFRKTKDLEATAKEISKKLKPSKTHKVVTPGPYDPMGSQDFEGKEEDREEIVRLLDGNTDAIKFWEAFQWRREVPIQELKIRLAQHFNGYTGTRRPLSHRSVDTMITHLQIWAQRMSVRISHKTISVEAFRIFWRYWYSRLCATICKIRYAWDHELVMGVEYSRGDINREVERGSVGCFMLRLSANNPGCIAMGFVSREYPKETMHILIDCKHSTGHFKITFDDGKSSTYRTLEELILHCKRVTVLYPRVISKQQAFGGASAESVGHGGAYEDEGPS